VFQFGHRRSTTVSLETKGLFTCGEEDPCARKILTEKADHPSAIRFLYSVYMQNAVLGPSTRIFLVLGSS